MPGILRPSAGYVGRGVTLQSALECMLYHQKSLAQVKPGRRRRAASHTFSPATRRFDCRQSHTSASSRKYQPLPTMPCSRGSVPVSIVDCAVHVTAGSNSPRGGQNPPPARGGRAGGSAPARAGGGPPTARTTRGGRRGRLPPTPPPPPAPPRG